MFNQKILLLVVCALLVVPTPYTTGAAASADVTCDRASTFRLDANSTSRPRNEQTCYVIFLPEKTSLLTIALEPIQGTFDLYYGGLGYGSSFTLTEADNKLNAYTIERPERYAFRPQSEAYIIAVVPVSPISADSKFRVKIATKTASAYSLPPGERSDPTVDGSVNIDLQPGEQVILPPTDRIHAWNCLSRITASANWSDSTQKLDLILTGPTGLDLQDPVASYHRTNDSPILSVDYTVTDADAQKGTRWEVRVVNLSSSVVTAWVKITGDRRTRCLPVTDWSHYECRDKSEITLRLGDRGIVLIDKIKLRDQTLKEIRQLQAKEHIRVIGGPQCYQGVTLWEVRTESGNTGWIPELILGKRLLKKVK